MGNKPSRTQTILVIGIGNAYRCDDAAGLVAARRLKGHIPECCSVVEHTGEGAALIELWKESDRVIVIDAVRSGAAPGTVSRFDATLHPLPVPMFRDSTHAFGLVEAVELSRALNQLPHQFIIYGIQGQDFGAGTNISSAMELAIREVVECVLRELLPDIPSSEP